MLGEPPRRRQGRPEGICMEEERTCPRMLPIIECDGRSWFVDERLGEFRDIWNPHRRVAFRSETGLVMLAVYALDRET